MKLKLIFTIVILSFIKNIKAQTINQLNVINLSINYTFNNGSYAPNNSFSYGEVLNTLQERYNYYHNLIGNEYYKLQNLQLINKENIVILNNFRSVALPWVYEAGSTWDLSQPANSNYILSFIYQIYNTPSVKNEIKILQQVKYEIESLKIKFPLTYSTNERYLKISEFLNKLTDCNVQSISDLGLKYGFYTF